MGTDKTNTLWALLRWLRDASPYLAGLGFALFLSLASTPRLKGAAGFAWPAAAVVLVFVLRNPLGRLLARLIEIKWGDKSARFEQGRVEEPAELATATTIKPTDAVSLKRLTSHAKKILATLWHYQQVHFPDSTDDRRWTFLVLPPSDYWTDYYVGGGELTAGGLIRSVRPDRRIFLSDAGMAFCKENAEALKQEERIVFPDG